MPSLVQWLIGIAASIFSKIMGAVVLWNSGKRSERLKSAEATIEDEKKLQEIRVKPVSDADVIDELRNGDF